MYKVLASIRSTTQTKVQCICICTARVLYVFPLERWKQEHKLKVIFIVTVRSCVCIVCSFCYPALSSRNDHTTSPHPDSLRSMDKK